MRSSELSRCLRWSTSAASIFWLTGAGCGGADTMTAPKPVDVAPAGPARPTGTFGVGQGTSASTRDEFAMNFLGIACAAYSKVCGCDAGSAGACTAEHNLNAVDLYDCMFTRAYCASPAGAGACPGIGEQSRKVYLDGNALCVQLDSPSLSCAAWMRNTFGGQDGRFARVLWDMSDPNPKDADTLIETCQKPPRVP